MYFEKCLKANHYLTGRTKTYCRKLIPIYIITCKGTQAHEHERNVLQHEFPSYEDHTLENAMNYGNIHRKAFDEYSIKANNEYTMTIYKNKVYKSL